MLDEAEHLSKRLKAAKPNFDLHVLLLMKQKKLTKPEAIWLAYLDGPLGLEARLAGRQPEGAWDAPKQPDTAKPEATK